MSKRIHLLAAFSAVVFLLIPPFGLSQDIDSPSIGVFGGSGLQHDSAWHGALQAGASVEESAPNSWIGYMFEGGYVGPTSNLHGGAGIFSANYVTSWNNHRAPTIFPFATVGYTQLFGTGNALNFGGGVDFRLSPGLAIRLESRDYVSFSPQHHNFAIRIGVRHFVED